MRMAADNTTVSNAFFARCSWSSSEFLFPVLLLSLTVILRLCRPPPDRTSLETHPKTLLDLNSLRPRSRPLTSPSPSRHPSPAAEAARRAGLNIKKTWAMKTLVTPSPRSMSRPRRRSKSSPLPSQAIRPAAATSKNRPYARNLANSSKSKSKSSRISNGSR